MDLTRRSPMRDLANIRDEMNRLLDDLFSSRIPTRRSGGIFEGEWIPSVDVSEDEGKVIVSAEIPGVKKNDLDITVTDNVLTLKGEKKEEKETKEENYHRIERSYGKFQRSISLPVGVDSSKAKANHKDGVLHIEIPKSEEAKPKQIKVGIGE